jgi:hypothetical protein
VLAALNSVLILRGRFLALQEANDSSFAAHNPLHSGDHAHSGQDGHHGAEDGQQHHQQQQRQQQQQELRAIVARIEPLCAASGNKNLQAALHLVSACCSHFAGDGVLRTKRFLEQAMATARQLANAQLTCMTLNFLNWKFLRGAVGTQAEKGARAAVATAKQSGNAFWIGVSKAMLADTLEVQGRLAEAYATRAEAQRFANDAQPKAFRPS